MNICGVLLRSIPAQRQSVRALVSAFPGVEVAAEGDAGQLILTVEDVAETKAADTLTEIQKVSGVITASIVYQHYDESLKNESLVEGEYGS